MQVHVGASLSGPPWSENGDVNGSANVSLHQNGHCTDQLSPSANYTMPRSTVAGTISDSHHLNSHYSATAIVHSVAGHSDSQSSLNFPAQVASFNRVDILQNEAEELEASGPYNPELSRSENPHYYTANEILYNAHIQRNQRYLNKPNSL